MPAESELQLYAFEGNFELATRTVLNAAGLSDVLIERANITLPESRIEVTFAAGDAINEFTRLDGRKDWDFFSNCRLSLRIVTVRTADQPANLLPGVIDLHETWAAGVRVALQESRFPFNAETLPFYSVQTLRPAGSARDLDARFMEDFTRLDYFIEFGIRSNAWPL
jgi:hypothetical protein